MKIILIGLVIIGFSLNGCQCGEKKTNPDNPYTKQQEK